MSDEEQPPAARTDHAPEAPAGPTAEQLQEAVDSAEFKRLRSAFRRFSFPMTFVFLAWYFFYVLASTFAPEFMATPVLGRLNLGLVLGLAQFLTTFLLTWVYIRRAGKVLDPMAASLRARLEGGQE